MGEIQKLPRLGRKSAALWTVALVTCAFPVAATAAQLKPETIKAWEEYVEASTSQMQGRLNSGGAFLWIDEAPDRGAKLRSGEIVVSPAGPHIPKRVPSGLIHHWTGAVFIPNTTLHDVFRVVRDYRRYKEIYHPAVIDSKPVATGELEDRFTMLLMNKSVVSKTALDSDYRSSYFRVNDQRWYCVSETMRVQEIADYGTSGQRTLPEGEGAGLIWRIHSVSRFEERDGGVYIEVEAMVLSRDIPVTLRWVVTPIVRRVSRESLQTSLKETQDAIRDAAKHRERDSAASSFR